MSSSLIYRVSGLRNAVILLMPALLGSCALLYRDLQAPGIQLVSVAPEQISFSGIKLLCRLRIDNPNDVSLPVRGGQIDLALGGLPVAHGELTDGFTIAARDTVFVNVVIDVDSASSIALLIRVISNGERELDYVLDGHVDIAISVLGRVHIEEKGSVPLTARPRSGREGGGII
jgi:LEA14-like dessication related protein